MEIKKSKPIQIGKKANVAVVMVMIAVLLLIVAAVSLADNGNGIFNWGYPDVTSGTDVVEGCTPKQYIVEFRGSLDLINQKQGTWTLDYDIDYLDAHIYDIYIAQKALGITGDTFDAQICLYDVLAGGDEWNKKQVACVEIADKVTYGQIEKYPFTFRYNLYDNDCNGLVDDHTFNLMTEIQSEDGKFIKEEKTVAIVNGEAIYQNRAKDGNYEN